MNESETRQRFVVARHAVSGDIINKRRSNDDTAQTAKDEEHNIQHHPREPSHSKLRRTSATTKEELRPIIIKATISVCTSARFERVERATTRRRCRSSIRWLRTSCVSPRPVSYYTTTDLQWLRRKERSTASDNSPLTILTLAYRSAQHFS